MGFSCYKSRDLLHWENCGLVLSAVNELGHDLHPDSVCERPSVLYNAETQKFVLWFHLDNRRYTRAEVGLAVSDTPTGPFAYMGSQRPGSHDSRDFTAFQDKDGRAYLFCSSDWNATMRVWELDKAYTKLTGSGKDILIDQRGKPRRCGTAERSTSCFHRAAPGGVPTRCCTPRAARFSAAGG